LPESDGLGVVAASSLEDEERDGPGSKWRFGNVWHQPVGKKKNAAAIGGSRVDHHQVGTPEDPGGDRAISLTGANFALVRICTSTGASLHIRGLSYFSYLLS
jgi:hypothetical protein